MSIPVSDDLLRTFDSTESDQIRAILVQNYGGKLQLIKSLPPTEEGLSDKEEFLPILSKLFSFEPTRSGYALYRLDSVTASGEWEWLCCAYQPVSAKIKEKMQYAVTRASLLTGLTERKFLDTIFGSSPNDFLWPTKLRNQRKHDYQNPQLKTAGKPASEAAGTGVGGARRAFTRVGTGSSKGESPEPRKAEVAPSSKPVEQVSEKKPVETFEENKLVDSTPEDVAPEDKRMDHTPEESAPESKHTESKQPAPVESEVETESRPLPPAVKRYNSHELTSAFKDPGLEEQAAAAVASASEVLPSDSAVTPAPDMQEQERSETQAPCVPCTPKAPEQLSQPTVPSPTEIKIIIPSPIKSVGTSRVTRQETFSSLYRSAPSSHGGPKLGFKWSDGVSEAIQGLGSTASGTSEWNLVLLSIDIKNEMVELEAPPRFVLPADLTASFSETEPRLAFYRLEVREGESIIAMLYCCPAASSVKARMVYSSNVLGIMKHVEKLNGLKVVKKIEASDRMDLMHSSISEEIHGILSRTAGGDVAVETFSFAQPRVDMLGVAGSFARPRRVGR